MIKNSIHYVNDSSNNLLNQFPKNLAANIGFFLVNFIIGLYLVPFFISTLSIAAYGFIPLVTSITGYVGIVVQSLNTSITRFLTVDLQRKDYNAANKIFNTAFFYLTLIVFIMIPVIVIFSLFIPTIFQIPVGQEMDSTFLFIAVSFSFLIRSWSGTYTVQLFAFNRLDLQNFVNITNLIIQTALIIFFFNILNPSLIFVGYAYLIGSIISSIISIILAKRVCPYLHISFSHFDRTKIDELSVMGFWVLINQIGTLLFLQIDIIIVNLLFGATSTGEYAIVLQLVILLRAIAGILSGVLTPTIISYFSKNQTNSLITVSKSAVKLLGLAMALPIGLICGFAPLLLTLWVGEQYAFLAPLMAIMTLHLAVNLAVLPLFSINVAYNCVRIPGIVTFLMGIWNFILAITLPLITGWGYYGVAIAGAIVLTLKNCIFTPWYASKIIGINIYTFIRSMIPGIFATIIIWIISSIFMIFLPALGIIELLPIVVLITGIYICFIWKYGLDTFEHMIIHSYLPFSMRAKKI